MRHLTVLLTVVPASVSFSVALSVKSLLAACEEAIRALQDRLAERTFSGTR
jgi:hypothetical protein